MLQINQKKKKNFHCIYKRFTNADFLCTCVCWSPVKCKVYFLHGSFPFSDSLSSFWGEGKNTHTFLHRCDLNLPSAEAFAQADQPILGLQLWKRWPLKKRNLNFFSIAAHNSIYYPTTEWCVLNFINIH